jgi:hypothetical protein
VRVLFTFLRRAADHGVPVPGICFGGHHRADCHPPAGRLNHRCTCPVPTEFS